jgi:DNA-binding GntR family transcriptional regulator
VIYVITVEPAKPPKRFEKITTKTLRQQVYDQLRRKIITAEILPGEAVSLRGLAEEFGVSLMPVREALWQLETEKVVVIESNKSVHVNTLTPEEMEEALRIRLLIETMAAERACDYRPLSAIPRVDKLLESMEANRDNPKKYIIMNNQFHLAIYSCANSPMLLRVIESIWARIGPYLIIQASRGGDLFSTMECHRGMCEAFAQRDKKTMRTFLQRDLEEAARINVPLLESFPEGKP